MKTYCNICLFSVLDLSYGLYLSLCQMGGANFGNQLLNIMYYTVITHMSLTAVFTLQGQ